VAFFFLRHVIRGKYYSAAVLISLQITTRMTSLLSSSEMALHNTGCIQRLILSSSMSSDCYALASCSACWSAKFSALIETNVRHDWHHCSRVGSVSRHCDGRRVRFVRTHVTHWQKPSPTPAAESSWGHICLPLHLFFFLPPLHLWSSLLFPVLPHFYFRRSSTLLRTHLFHPSARLNCSSPTQEQWKRDMTAAHSCLPLLLMQLYGGVCVCLSLSDTASKSVSSDDTWLL